MKEKGYNRNCGLGLGLGIKLWFSPLSAKRMSIFHITCSHTPNQRKRGPIARTLTNYARFPITKLFGDNTSSIPPAHGFEHCYNPPQTSIFMSDLSANEMYPKKLKNKMFKRVTLTFGNSSFEIFAGRDLSDVYATVSELAQALEVQPATVRAQLSGSLTKLPDLAAWLTNRAEGDDYNMTPTSANGKTFFAPSSSWKMLLKDRIPSDIWVTIKQAIRSTKEGPWDSNLMAATIKRTRPAASEDGSEINSDGDDDNSSSSDSSSSDEDEDDASLPRNTPAWILTEPIIPDQQQQFSRDDYTKSYSLKSYHTPKSLKKELKKLSKWWTKERNAERKGAKAVQGQTADKREERILCFLGFVQRYKCLSDKDKSLTVALYLNHRLFESYLNYLKEVRNCSDGTIGEALTAAVCACRWLYRKESKTLQGNTPQITRRYMDYRNVYQAKAIRQRSQNDVDELQEQNKWLEWDQFTALIAKLRAEWTETSSKVDFEPTNAAAHQLHDLLLLGLYSCVPDEAMRCACSSTCPKKPSEPAWAAPKPPTRRRL